ncbi:MAG: type II CAAX endopeptidase family protein [Bacteroidales bacterium]|nr:type II CAAX endopeptidase family protein [Bacteroidales bacterium]
MKKIIKVLLTYLTIQISVALVMMIIYIIVNNRDIETLSKDALLKVSLSAIVVADLITILYLVMWKLIPLKRNEFFTFFNIPNIFLVTIVTFGSIIIETFISQVCQLPNVIEMDIFLDVFGVIGAVILAPIMEEMIFRGIVLKTLLKTHSVWKSIVVSSLIFGFIHFNPAQSLTAFIIGLLLGWLYYKTKSLWAPIFVHFLNNFSSVYLMYEYPQLESQTLVQVSGGYLNLTFVLALSSLLAALGIYILNARINAKVRLEITPDRHDSFNLEQGK